MLTLLIIRNFKNSDEVLTEFKTKTSHKTLGMHYCLKENDF